VFLKLCFEPSRGLPKKLKKATQEVSNMAIDLKKDTQSLEQLSDCGTELVQQLRRDNAALKLKNDILTAVITKLNNQTTKESETVNSCSALLIKLEEMSHEKVSIIQRFEQEEGISFSYN
jgi:hypothetical protein